MNIEQKRLHLALLIEKQYRDAERSLAEFIKAAWPILEPNNPLKWNWHLDLVCEYLELVYEGKILRLIINIPPRNLKSIIASVAFPGWVFLKRPSDRFLYGSYSQSLSTKHSVDCRELIQSPWYQRRWGDRFRLSDDQNQKTEFKNNHRGHRIATSMGATATGKGGDYVIIDDPHDVTSARSAEKRQTQVKNFREKFTNRLDNKEEGRIVVVMQRLHEKDLTGDLLPDGEYIHLCLPAIAEKDETIVFPKSGRIIERKAGDILHPERESFEILEKTKKALGSYGFAGQYLQRPTPPEGGIIKRNDIQFYKELPADINVQIQSWDFTFKDKENSDFVVGLVMARHGGNYYLIDCVRDRMSFSATLKAFESFTAKHPKALAKYVEEKANGSAIIDTLKGKISGIIAVNPKESKSARFESVSPLFEAHNVYFPHPTIAPWINDFIEEVVSFPNAAHDDRVDALSQGLEKLKSNSVNNLMKLVTS